MFFEFMESFYRQSTEILSHVSLDLSIVSVCIGIHTDIFMCIYSHVHKMQFVDEMENIP